jgi:hypothetical protein
MNGLSTKIPSSGATYSRSLPENIYLLINYSNYSNFFPRQNAIKSRGSLREDMGRAISVPARTDAG